MKIGEYTLIGELKNDDSGYAKWGFCRKGRKEFFIKEFLSPVYPPDDAPFSLEQIERKRSVCVEFEKRKQELYNKLIDCSTGNIVFIENFFRHDSKYYIVTEKVESDKLDVSDISEIFTPEQKEILVKVLCYNVSHLHSHGVVHGDIKPNNVMIKQTKGGYTAKLIDFDSSFLESSPPSFDDLQGDMVYFAPESFMLLANEEGKINRKVDVFALGLLFHEYYTGKPPSFDRKKYDYAFEAVLDGAELKIFKSIPDKIAKQISLMLSKNPESRPELKNVFEAISNIPAPTLPVTKKEEPNHKSTPEPVKASSFFKKANSDDLL